MIGSGGSTSVLFHRFAEAEEDSPAYKLFIKHIEPDIDSTTFDSDRFVTNTMPTNNPKVKNQIFYLLETD